MCCWEKIPASFENPCGSWAGFKLSRYLTELTGLAKYGDWIELLLYNAIGAALPMTGYGRTYYYCDYAIKGGSKEYYPTLWPCCSGTYPLAVSEYHNLIYYKDANGIYANLFVPSQVEWQHNGQTIRITQETDFPREEQTRFSLRLAQASRFAFHFRVPGWVKGTVSAHVNGEAVPVAAQPGSWATIEREWQDGDRVTIHLPMSLEFIPIEPVAPVRVALRYGPVVLVTSQAAEFHGDRADPSAWIQPTGQPLQFSTQSGAVRATFEPYYQKGLGEKYFMYVKVL